MAYRVCTYDDQPKPTLPDFLTEAEAERAAELAFPDPDCVWAENCLLDAHGLTVCWIEEAA